MCHNADLVVSPPDVCTPSLEEVWGFLSRRKGLVDGVVITGGEPTLQSDLAAFLRRLREFGLDAKLDTNGYRPDILAEVLDDGLLDYIAMDVKAPPEKYPLLSGREDVDLARVERSIDLLLESDLSCEFRTTAVPGLLVEEDIEEIAHWIQGAELYVLQQFRPLGTLDPGLEGVTPYSLGRLEEMADRAEAWVNQTLVRG
jgi:pyruvate formate lyase activating enzyme